MANPVLACGNDDSYGVIIVVETDYNDYGSYPVNDPSINPVAPCWGIPVFPVRPTFPGYPIHPGYPIFPVHPVNPIEPFDPCIPGPGGNTDGRNPYGIDPSDNQGDRDNNNPTPLEEGDYGIPAPAEDQVEDTAVPSSRPDETPVVNEDPAVNENPVVNENPTVDQTPTVDPVNNEQPAVVPAVETPAASEAPAATTSESTGSSSGSSASAAPAASGAPAAQTRVLGATSNGVEAFVRRLYSEVLDRSADEAGVNHWVGLLRDNKATAAQVANGFFGSQEFLNKDISDEEFVDMLYSTFFNRKADEQGREHWLDMLDDGMSRQSVIESFTASEEWANFCSGYSIKAR